MDFISPILLAMPEMEKRIIVDQLTSLFQHKKKVPQWILVIEYIEHHPFRIQLVELVQRRTLLRVWNMGIVLMENDGSRETLKVWDSHSDFEETRMQENQEGNLSGLLAHAAPGRSGHGNMAWVKYLCNVSDGTIIRFPPGENWKQMQAHIDARQVQK